MRHRWVWRSCSPGGRSFAESVVRSALALAGLRRAPTQSDETRGPVSKRDASAARNRPRPLGRDPRMARSVWASIRRRRRSRFVLAAAPLRRAPARAPTPLRDRRAGRATSLRGRRPRDRVSRCSMPARPCRGTRRSIEARVGMDEPRSASASNVSTASLHPHFTGPSPPSGTAPGPYLR
jgi:hypothetical protein